jgi:glutaredoxin
MMRRATWVSGLALLFIVASAHAQLYKWVSPDGTVSYSDTPPPASATKVEQKSYGGGSAQADLPYELAEAAKGNPVALYAMPNCPACDAGRALLNGRGIPFSEKTVASNDDIERLRQLSGNTQLPVLVVGRNKQTGFEPGEWSNALTNAGYPTTNKLPKSYNNPAPEPAAPSAGAAAGQSNTGAAKKPVDIEQQGVITPPPPLGNAPPGFQF